MNLLEENWIPVRYRDGSVNWITPCEISKPDIESLEANRAEFNAALIQFLIGLLQTTCPMDSEIQWREWSANPPDTEELKHWFSGVKEAFIFDGDGARFMQDFSLQTRDRKDKDFSSISALLIDSPGENTLKENKDHFVKRDSIKALCFSCAATALYTLQTNAPSGGAGHNTSIRGGGPLSTLVVEGSATTLWSKIWINIKNRSDFLAHNGDASKTALEYTFPWLKELQFLQAEKGQLSPIQVHPAHNFWGTPRRIRLDLDNTSSGQCHCCGRNSDKLVGRYITKARGYNYKGGWSHPLSPYYESKPGEYLAMHPQPGGIGYKHWLAYLLGLHGKKKKVQPASIVSYVLESNRLQGRQCRLWAFGFDMDNMKARCWYESTLPLYGIPNKKRIELNLLQREIQRWLEAADLTAFYLRAAIKSAWFGDGDTRGNFEFIDAKFWSGTEGLFYSLLRTLVDQLREEDDDDPVLNPLRQNWRDNLIKTAIHVFDADVVGSSPISQQNPARIANAYNRLSISLRNDKLKTTLKLPVKKPEKPVKKTKSSKRAA